MQQPIYLDHHATTPCDPRVVEKMLPFFSEVFGNPASIVHQHGRRASLALEEARSGIARLLGVFPPEVCFTAGATESNNTALNLLQPGDHLVTSATEHKSVLAAAARLERRGVEVTRLAPDREGFITTESLIAALKPQTRLVSIEAANGEIGTIQPIPALSAACRERGVLFHTDATQALGKIPLDLTNVDLASFSAHKLYGPKGIGALYVRRGVKVEPLVVGGGQERGIRSGTVNLAGAVGFAEALRLASESLESEAARLTELRDSLKERLLDTFDDISINGPGRLRLPGNLNVSFGRVEADALILAMKRFSLSSGSACSSGDRGPSHVLTAIGVDEAKAIGSIRFGLGRSNTVDQIELLIGDLARAVRKLREISPL